jgi:hypothetical protein
VIWLLALTGLGLAAAASSSSSSSSSSARRVQCSSSGDCPPGYQCGADGFCCAGTKADPCHGTTGTGGQTAGSSAPTTPEPEPELDASPLASSEARQGGYYALGSGYAVTPNWTFGDVGAPGSWTHGEASLIWALSDAYAYDYGMIGPPFWSDEAKEIAMAVLNVWLNSTQLERSSETAFLRRTVLDDWRPTGWAARKIWRGNPTTREELTAPGSSYPTIYLPTRDEIFG